MKKRLQSTIKNWHQKTVWIIGASSGIGHALACEIAELGAIVYVSARSEDKLTEMAENFETIHAKPVDATNYQDLKQVYEEITCERPLEVLIHAAAMYEPMLVKDFDKKLIHESMQLNYGSVIDVLDIVLPDMQKRKSGHIGIIASVAGYIGLPNALAYGATKAALINLSESLYAELSDENIHVKLINPGFVKSSLTDKNDFEMPFLINPKTAALEIIKGFKTDRFEIHFPRKFTSMMKVLHIFPYRLSLSIIKKMAEATK